MLPDELDRLTQLEDLVRGVQESTLPFVLTSRTTRQCLGKNGLRVLPAGVTSLPLLRRLQLEHNHLDALLADLARLTQLTDLSLTGNALTALPDALAALTQLRPCGWPCCCGCALLLWLLWLYAGTVLLWLCDGTVLLWLCDGTVLLWLYAVTVLLWLCAGTVLLWLDAVVVEAIVPVVPIPCCCVASA
jgi:hypothetical protein